MAVLRGPPTNKAVYNGDKWELVKFVLTPPVVSLSLTAINVSQNRNVLLTLTWLRPSGGATILTAVSIEAPCASA